MTITTRWKCCCLLFIFIVMGPKSVNLAPPHGKSCSSCNSNTLPNGEAESDNNQISTTSTVPPKAFPPPKPGNIPRTTTTTTTTTTTPAPQIFGCTSEMQQTFSNCLGKCTNSTCCVQELFNFLSACSSGVKQNCTTTTTRNVDCDQCGIANYRESRRIGGTPKRPKIDPTRVKGGIEVNPHRRYPWQVGLFHPKSNEGIIFCGGSIINNRWILTAAHCVVEWDSCKESNATNGLQVRVGEHNQFTNKDDDFKNTKDYTVKRIVIHPDWDCSKTNYDLALLELTREIPFNDVIKPVCLPKDDSKTYARVNATVTGWGLTVDRNVPPDVLMEVDVPIHAQYDCKGWGIVEDTKLCAGPLPGKYACQGDSGGPLVVKEGNKYIQVGVMSYGVPCDEPSDDSGVYSRVSKVLDWIKNTTTSGKCC